MVDLANAHVASLKKGLNSSESIKIYNVGTGKGASVMDVVTAFEKVSNQKLNYEFGPRREGDVPEIYSDNELIKNEIAVIAVSSNDASTHPEDSFEKMKQLSINKNLPFSYLYDETQEVAKAYDAACTPDFFGFNFACFAMH